jgi:peptide chain release factor 1
MSVEEALRKRLAAAATRHQELLAQMERPEVASDHARAAAVMKEFGRIARLAGRFADLARVEADLAEAREMLAAAEDDEIRTLAGTEIEEKEARVRAILSESLDDLTVQNEFEGRDVILEVRAGTGGDEAALFAADLFRMYTRFAERNGYRIEVLFLASTGLGGLKEVVASVAGRDVFRRLRFESGGHRVQRVPETEAQGRIHTSLATVAVMPEAEEVDVDLRREDLKIDFFRASGPGGQKVNKTSSAVRIVHVPTGLKVECQDEKSQHKNKARAMKILLSRIMDFHRTKADAERASMRRNQIGSGDRNERIRTYNFPQNRVTDHRINLTIKDLVAVMDGNLDDLLSALEESDREVRLRAFEQGGATA